MSVLSGEAARRALDRVSYNRRHATTMRPIRTRGTESDHRLPAARPVPAGDHDAAAARPTALTLARPAEAGHA
jgi:hypothetical protein